MGKACGTYERQERWVQDFDGRPGGKTSLRRPGHRWDDNFKWIFKKWDGDAWTGLLWLRIETGGGCL
jgi:hypothetical protein